MRAWAKNKLLTVAILLLSCLFTAQILAGEFSAQIKTASLEQQDDWYVLAADIEHILSPVAKEAIESSIPLVWCLKIKLKKEGYFYSKTLVKINYRYTIRHHALLNIYSVTNTTTQVQKKYASLAEALDALSRIRDLKIVQVSALQKDQLYEAEIKLKFDKEQLPPPLRPIAYFNSEWDLSSDWYLWSLQKN
jgi:hypothetical protein